MFTIIFSKLKKHNITDNISDSVVKIWDILLHGLENHVNGENGKLILEKMFNLLKPFDEALSNNNICEAKTIMEESQSVTMELIPYLDSIELQQALTKIVNESTELKKKLSLGKIGFQELTDFLPYATDTLLNAL